MKSNDNVRVFGHSLLIHFGSTGESQAISTIDLDSRGVSFSLSPVEKIITAQLHDSGAVVPIESFATEQLANAGYQYLQGQLKRYMRQRRCAAWYKGAIRWVFGPLLAFVFVVSVNTAVTTSLVNRSVASSAPTLAVQQQGLPPSGQVADSSSRPLAEATRTAKPRPDSKLLANALRDGVASNKYSVQLSSGSKGSLYVFSDPLCPYCQRLEPQLEQLMADYTVHVFPVSVIGGNASQKQLGPMLCGTPDARAGLWKQAIAGGSDKETTSCDQAAEVLEANNEFFRAMLFDGTPVIVNEHGKEFPTTQRATAENIKQWLVASAGVGQ
ncbi:DsbC family protein [Pseudomonas monteilii]|uniref:DsbC family protein n=1 Tax=Pseudomonas monteilii TaxID=76759 RepID=UPI0015FBC6B1|nr:DsbC family protein [Pseudomonas monteilii]MBA6105252.1 DsbC family protein [Pseudomonas monteilii]